MRVHLTNENFTDLLEEGIRQAARSVTAERRAYIASLLVQGITSDKVDFIESKHLLRILGEINDIEVLWLRFFLVPTKGGDEEFRNKHSEFLDIPPATSECSRAIRDKNAMKVSYIQHLEQLGVIALTILADDAPFGRIEDPEEQETDPIDGITELSYYKITALGVLLLRHLSLTTREYT